MTYKELVESASNPPFGVAIAIFVIDVALKSEILDTQGRAVLGALSRLGLSGVGDVR